MPIQYSSYSTPREDLGAAIYEFDPSQEGFIALRALPVLDVSKKAANVSVLTRENLKRPANRGRRATGATFGRIALRAEDTSFECKGYGLEIPLPDEDRDNYAAAFDAELDSVMVLHRQFLIELELRVKAALWNTTTFTGAALYTDRSAAPWDAAATDVVAHVEAVREKVRQNCGRYPNTMVIGASTLSSLRLNTGIKALFPGVPSLTRNVLIGALPEIFAIPNILVGGQIYDSAAEGQDFTTADIWNEDYCWIGVSASGSIRTPSVGRTVLWSHTPDIITTEQYREEQTKSDIFRIEHWTDEKIFDPYFGHLLLIDA